MKDFRSICIIYNMEDTYRAYYIKEFFKWIGLSYVAVVNKPGRNLFDNEEYYKFDVIVNYNDAIDKDQCQKIEERTKNALVSVDDKDGKSEKNLLDLLINEIIGNKFDGNRMFQGLFMALAKIYDMFKIVNLLYEYTFILLSGLSENTCDMIFQRCNKVVRKTEQLVQLQINGNKKIGLEYALYAQYYSIKQVNEFLWIKKRTLQYDTEKYLNDVNEIYDYDEEYFKVEALKGRIAEFDNRFSALPKNFYENAIQDCQLKVCKSYHYYTLGKWKEKIERSFEASIAYQKSYAADPMNIKAMFKLGVEQKKTNQNLMAEGFFIKIIRNLEERYFLNKEEMSLREIEYLYKVFCLEAEICESQFQHYYRLDANECMKFVKELIEYPEKKDFALKMYGSSDLKMEIASAMRLRLENGKWNCMYKRNMGRKQDGKE